MVLLVTGARSGFGLGVAVEAARRGHVVYAGLRDIDTRDDLVARSAGLDVRPVQLDITRAAEREAVLSRIVEEEGRLDALVNNAGVALGGFLEEVDEDEVRKVFEVNVFATWALTRDVLPTMRAQGSGRIVMLSSASAVMPLPGMGVYAASKSALEGMSESLRHEVAPFGIDVSILQPGPYDTDIWGRNRTLARSVEDDDSPYAAIRQRVDERITSIARGNMRDPHEVVERILTLCEGTGPSTFRHPMGPGVLQRRLIKLLPFRLVEGRLRKKLIDP